MALEVSTAKRLDSIESIDLKFLLSINTLTLSESIVISKA